LDEEFNAERISTFSASERLMCSFLIESLNATPLNSIIFVSRAVMMLPTLKAEKYEINADELTALFSISERLVFVSKNTQGSGRQKYMIDFSSLDYKKHIEPWAKMNAYDYYVPKNNISAEKTDTILEELDSFDKIVYSIKNLTETGYQHMCSDFLMYAVPITQNWAYIISTRISPDTYIDMLKVYKGVKND